MVIVTSITIRISLIILILMRMTLMMMMMIIIIRMMVMMMMMMTMMMMMIILVATATTTAVAWRMARIAYNIIMACIAYWRINAMSDGRMYDSSSSETFILSFCLWYRC